MREGWKRGAAPSPIKRNRSPSGLPRVLGAGTDAPSGCPRPRRRSPAGLWLERNQSTCGLQAGQAVVKAIRCFSNLTRPVSWLGPASSGMYPHTKGARCSAGGHRHRIPSTASGLLAPRSLAGQGVGRPFADGRKHLDQRNRDERDSIEKRPSRPASRDRPMQDAHTVAEGNARWGVPRGAGGLPAVGKSWRGRGRRGRQFALGRRRGVLEVRLDAPRFPAGASSTGCVPLQSG